MVSYHKPTQHHNPEDLNLKLNSDERETILPSLGIRFQQPKPTVLKCIVKAEPVQLLYKSNLTTSQYQT